MSFSTILILFFLILGILYILVCLVMYLLQEKFIFFPTKLSPNYTFSQFNNIQEMYYQVEEAVKIHALLFNVENPKGIVLYFHGNARGVDDWGYAAADLTKHGYNVLMPDYRGYGKSQGTVTELNMYKDAEYVFKDLLKTYKAEDIIVYGRSMGSGVSCELVSKYNVRQLILETPYLSVLQVAKDTMPFLPISKLIKYQFRNDLKIGKIESPIHIFHGTKDELIPYYHAVELAKYSKQQNNFTTIEGGTHNNLPEFTQFQEVLQQILEKGVQKK